VVYLSDVIALTKTLGWRVPGELDALSAVEMRSQVKAPTPRQLAKADRNLLIKKLCDNGLSNKEIAAKVGLKSASQVGRILKALSDKAK
jgi:DNA-binding NarL/FixJ family response regulator